MSTEDKQAPDLVTRHGSTGSPSRVQSRDPSRVTPHVLRGEKGIALLTVVLLLVALTVIGIAAMTVTGMENKMAGYGRSAETVSSAAEACMGTAVKIIQ
ncbi:MAG: hypothetical protein HZB35_04840, partial [Nitrospirae bacterium]|nr:hypothetical protein [Nitrospirota bacterium]